MPSMKSSIKAIMVKIFDPLATRLGYNQRDANIENEGTKNGLLNNFYQTLRSIGFIPEHIVDIGANRGTWTRKVLEYFPNAYYTLVEPQAWMKKDIQDLLEKNNKIQFHGVGAGEKQGSFKFTIVDRDDSCSFAYTEEEAKKLGFEQVEVPVVTLNEFLPSTTLPIPDIIKIDAEGLDIGVLKGASDYFGKTEVFMVEVGVVNKIFDNSFLKMVNFMDEQGYRLFDITDLNRPFETKVLWLAELVFVRKNAVIDSRKFV